MEPRIQYAKTTDGVSLAYLSLGHGYPIVQRTRRGRDEDQPQLGRWTVLW